MMLLFVIKYYKQKVDNNKKNELLIKNRNRLKYKKKSTFLSSILYYFSLI